jgi:hypothetical protein
LAYWNDRFFAAAEIKTMMAHILINCIVKAQIEGAIKFCVWAISSAKSKGKDLTSSQGSSVMERLFLTGPVEWSYLRRAQDLPYFLRRTFAIQFLNF